MNISLTFDVVFGEAFDNDNDNDNDNLMKISLTLDVVFGEAFASSRRFTICE